MTDGITISIDDIWHLGILISVWIGIILVVVVGSSNKAVTPLTTTTTSITTTTISYPTVKCKIGETKFYYSPQCGYCQRQMTDGSLTALSKSGVSIQMVDVTKGKYDFIQYTPTWILNNMTSVGYKTWDELMAMFQCQ